MPLFDRYLIVDWSASNAPARGKDSIWIALADQNGLTGEPENLATRHAAMERVRTICADTIGKGQRLLAGFDFAFGYPAGFAEALAQLSLPLEERADAEHRGGGEAGWQAVWATFESLVTDDAHNRSNRFDLAARINRDAFNGSGPFWNHPPSQCHDGLPMTKPDYARLAVAERRHVENSVKKAQPVWKLFTTGSVGSQAMLGIAHLEALRRDFANDLAIWPFETRFADDLSKPLTIAEIYPSLWPVSPEPGEVKDRAQVRMVAERFASLDRSDALQALLACSEALDDKACSDVLSEEGWIVGAGQREPIVTATGGATAESVKETQPRRFDYIRDPAEIYRQSFAIVEREADIARFSPVMRKVATRLVHSCGMIDVLDDLSFSGGAAEAGVSALKRGCKIYCDVEMVRSGVIAANLPEGCRLACTLNDPRAADIGLQSGNTRSASAVDLWDELDGSICVIGNAPTALFRLLERMDEGAGTPALIIGIPVGFVGAVESKRELADNPRGSPFITVHGRRGGSAMASSVVNALMFLAGGKS